MSGVVSAASAIAAMATLLKADPGIAGVYTSADSGATGPMASLKLQFISDGTWTIVRGSGDMGTGSPLSGTWYTGAPVAGIGASHEVKFTPTSGAATVNNTASTFQSLNAVQSITVSVFDGEADWCTFNIEARQIGTTAPTCSGSTTFDVQSIIGGGDGGSILQ